MIRSIALVRQTRRVSPQEASAIAEAVSYQIAVDVAPAWGVIPFPVVAVDSLAQMTPDAIPLVLLDDADQAGALGYHAETPLGQPYGRVFVSPSLDAGAAVLTGADAVSVTVSHEALEILGDVRCNLWADGPDGCQVALELCDPVEGDAYEVLTSGGRTPVTGPTVRQTVSVSNFILPEWFDPRATGPRDFLGQVTDAYGMSSGGYMIRRSATGEVSQVFASTAGQERFAARITSKGHPAARGARRGAFPAPRRGKGR